METGRQKESQSETQERTQSAMGVYDQVVDLLVGLFTVFALLGKELVEWIIPTRKSIKGETVLITGKGLWYMLHRCS